MSLDLWEVLIPTSLLVHYRESILPILFLHLDNNSSSHSNNSRSIRSSRLRLLLLSKDPVLGCFSITGHLPTLEVISLRHLLGRVLKVRRSTRLPTHIYGQNIRTLPRNAKLQADKLFRYHQHLNLKKRHLGTPLARLGNEIENLHPFRDARDNIRDSPAMLHLGKQMAVTLRAPAAANSVKTNSLAVRAREDN